VERINLSQDKDQCNFIVSPAVNHHVVSGYLTVMKWA